MISWMKLPADSVLMGMILLNRLAATRSLRSGARAGPRSAPKTARRGLNRGQSLVPCVPGSVMQPGPDLRDDLAGQVAASAGCLLGGHAMRDAVEKRPREHIAG